MVDISAKQLNVTKTSNEARVTFNKNTDLDDFKEFCSIALMFSRKVIE